MKKYINIIIFNVTLLLLIPFGLSKLANVQLAKNIAVAFLVFVNPIAFLIQMQLYSIKHLTFYIPILINSFFITTYMLLFLTQFDISFFGIYLLFMFLGWRVGFKIRKKQNPPI